MTLFLRHMSVGTLSISSMCVIRFIFDNPTCIKINSLWPDYTICYNDVTELGKLTWNYKINLSTTWFSVVWTPGIIAMYFYITRILKRNLYNLSPYPSGYMAQPWRHDITSKLRRCDVILALLTHRRSAGTPYIVLSDMDTSRWWCTYLWHESVPHCC